MSLRLWGLLLLAMLVGCGGPVHRTELVPSPQNPQRKPWQRPYKVDGQQYDPLLDHQGFVQTGTASWYGEKFHGRKTSNGETYNMYDMTAAHKTLPLGVSVRVTQLDTGRSVVVRVNDRGPFVKGRIIDLSYAAAKDLGIVGAGTGPVRVEALGYREQAAGGAVAYRAPVNYGVGVFGVQVGAFSQAANAQRLAERLRPRYGAVQVQQGLWEKGAIYRVWVGRYGSLDEAEQKAGQLTAEGFGGCFVIGLES